LLRPRADDAWLVTVNQRHSVTHPTPPPPQRRTLLSILRLFLTPPQVIAEYCRSRLTSEQQSFLSESFQRLNITTHRGVNIGTVVVDCGEYVGGLARVAQQVGKQAGGRRRDALRRVEGSR
jgi:hypothetical protein